jgi:predicted transposase YdaD
MPCPKFWNIDRLNQQTSPANAGKILSGAYILSGLRMGKDEARTLFRRIQAVQESTTYQAILEEGEVRGTQNMLLKQGAIRFGKPSRDIKIAIKQIEDLKKLRRMVIKVLSASSWQQLLAAD